MKVKIIFQNLLFSIIQIRNKSFSEILLIKEKFITPFFSLLQYYFCKNNSNLYLVVTFLFTDGMISNFVKN